jgi:hypothetical protein
MIINKIIRVDIDETICLTPDSRDYNESKPITENIKKINSLYDNGNTIIYWTSRGSTTGINWMDLTKKQLKKWGVKYHKLELTKPYYDFFIDDKVINIKDIEKVV